MSNSTSRNRNGALDYNNAHMRAQCRQLATVVAISGRVDTTNIGAVIEYTRRFILAEKHFVLDLSGVDSFAAQCISLFYTVDGECRSAGLEWALVASPLVTRQLRIRNDPAMFPSAGSVAEALHHFADDTLARRCRLLPLFAKTA